MTRKIVTVHSEKFDTKQEYVCWIDIMGTKNTMSESFHKAANFILKFHCIVLRSVKGKENVHVYPLMDGVFITSTALDSIRAIIDSIYTELSKLFQEEKQHSHRFIVKGSISYGHVAHGADISEEVCKELKEADGYQESLMCGMPMIQAFNDEHKAPPFGVYIHESARLEKVLSGRYYDWYHGKKKENISKLQAKIIDYFDWCENHYLYLCMDKQKISLYKHLVKEYFHDRSGKDVDTVEKDAIAHNPDVAQNGNA